MDAKKNPEKSVFGFAAAAILVALLFCAATALGQNAPIGNRSAVESDAGVLFMLLQIQADIQGNLNDLDLDVATASQNLSSTRLEGTSAREVLRKLLGTNSNVVEASTFNRDGKIIIAEGKESKGSEGADISSQEHVSHVLKTKTPTFSNQFRLIEGYNGTALEYPVFSPQGEFIGGISAIIEPYKLMNSLVAPELTNSQINTTDYSFWLMLPDGLIAYDRHPSEIGKYLFVDPLYKPYPSLLALGKKMVTARSGHDYYSFPINEENRTVVTKECYWTTVGLHGIEWRLAVTKIMG